MVFIHIQLLNIELVMEKGFLDKVEDNAVVRIWSDKTQEEKGDSLMEGYMLELWDFTHISDLILAHLDIKKRVDVFALSIYGLVILPRALGHIDDAVSDLFDMLEKRVTPVSNYSPLKEFMATPKRDNISEKNVDGTFGYAPLLVLRQYRLRQLIPVTQENTQPIEKHLQVIPSELEIIKQDFENRSSELEKKIEQLEEEKIQLGIDVDV
ncbi:hypothetical protein Goshw_023743 [Gossypium schwendimanii]|uniref:Uncharacterized protein n=1 Tax=Gossypium schwendimanii TaxID=34291 RepID=A0A7J9LXT1_GOSSC|nr:hypothetical protein [Gossypium schwendimanii]